MRSWLALVTGKKILWLSRLFHLGAGGTWPGEIALRIDPHILQVLTSKIHKGVIIVAGTNGKTTTSLMIKQILEQNGERVVHNRTGANLLNGVVSALIINSDWWGNVDADWGVFEVDENSLPVITSNFQLPVSNQKKLVVVLLNLFRDQLDRYGEVDVIAKKWTDALRHINSGNQNIKRYQSTVILNADDPLIAHLGNVMSSRARRGTSLGISHRLSTVRNDKRIIYFGINDKSKFLKEKEHATDSTFCLSCGARLIYEGIYYSHIGIWKCSECGENRPKPDISTANSPLPGVYNLYNTLAAVAAAKSIGATVQTISTALKSFQPAFGRQEEFRVDGKQVKLFLSKNPTGFNQTLKTIIDMGARQVLLVLNDRIPDGTDVSWIWDVDFEQLPAWVTSIVSGDRALDLAVRLKYSKPFHTLPKGAVSATEASALVYPKLETALDFGIHELDKNAPLYILSTYSAMLEVRKILTGKKIL